MTIISIISNFNHTLTTYISSIATTTHINLLTIFSLID
nr:MAG TPA: hypothetical protein [Caudoviricetes sp.]